MRPPKPTTSAALRFSPAATRFHLALTQDQRERYLRREQFDPTPEQAAANSPGQVVVSYRGVVLGVAILHRSGIIEMPVSEPVE